MILFLVDNRDENKLKSEILSLNRSSHSHVLDIARGKNTGKLDR